MFLSLIECNEELYQEAKSFFLKQGRSDLLSKTQPSLIGAYKVTEYMLTHGKTKFSFVSGEYHYEDLYFSTSHSGNYVAIIINTKKTAIDLEFVIPRDTSLLNGIKKLNTSFTDQENFYIQRCCKECIVKILDGNAEDMEDVEIKSCNENIVEIGGCQFNYLLTLSYKSNIYQISVSYQNNRVLAVL